MKVIDKIKKAEAENRFFWSFEYFPPKTPQGVQNLYDRMERMQRLGPEFIDVTWGAGGTSSELTTEMVATAQSVYGLETMMHLTCTNMEVSKIDTALKAAKECGCQNILALRGDPPKGQLNWESCENGFSHAEDLVRYIRKQYGDYFCIAVAGHPEGHIDNPDKEDDLLQLKKKVDAGADLIVTQLFFDVEMFLDFVKRCRDIGITCPILPGVLPIQNYNGLKRVISFNNNHVPQKIWDDLEPIKDDDAAVKEYGINLTIEFIRRFWEAGILGFHIYTFNLERSTRIILERLNLVPSLDQIKPLPWNPALTSKRAKENVRPIFWKNRTKSYIQRTETWDEFPNGRWGDSRSPAFGELDGWGVSLKYPTTECLNMWGKPETIDDIALLFAKYCKGSLAGIPWSAQQLDAETETIRQRLAAINLLGYLTINSQPAVNGAKSSHKIYGWGPKDGYVFQKAYLEFFISPERLDDIIKKISKDPQVTYFAVNRQGDFRTNAQSDQPNAVTWGVFPGKEIVQPTIVEPMAFMAWKDEAFELWNEWAHIYDRESPSAKLILDIANNWYLINIVHNDFQDEGGIWRLFDLEIDGEISRKLRQSLVSAQR
ncbi:methylenetetrahydrofolate reductase-domain-containing protein [Radiomyces spectabilis]|uniref:methylenetetrahydrofolate reductase-domain-containing protein n=1 Tax=Radiomyces spectabilis TaxID=64574 RepID=UPI002221110D|nr:methylenetetrahydrofolate reductase-domain-containing protein [Radiomyces spectabilis]KAI8370463.1 methylenetetrahydrofolate reductase-domain-containing protein [Radiomyces spectabilis]